MYLIQRYIEAIPAPVIETMKEKLKNYFIFPQGNDFKNVAICLNTIQYLNLLKKYNNLDSNINLLTRYIESMYSTDILTPALNIYNSKDNDRTLLMEYEEQQELYEFVNWFENNFITPQNIPFTETISTLSEHEQNLISTLFPSLLSEDIKKKYSAFHTLLNILLGKVKVNSDWKQQTLITSSNLQIQLSTINPQHRDAYVNIATKATAFMAKHISHIHTILGLLNFQKDITHENTLQSDTQDGNN